MQRKIGIGALTQRELDCLNTVELLTKNEWPARITDIARSLRVKPPSVVELVDRLDEKGMLQRGPGGIRISKVGTRGLRELHRSHRIFELMLTQMGMPLEVACRESKRIEGHSSRNVIKAICNYLGHPRVCPHGVPIEPDMSCCLDKKRPW